ncbi:MAG TPA: DUF6153 family protein [Kribbella sp.]|jgi:hypothetical protein
MSIQGAGRKWSGLTRVLAVLGVLAGVFAMHGLTGNHDVTMVGPHLSASTTEANHATDHPAAAQSAVISVDEHQHAMTGACVAILTALVLLLALSLGLRSLSAWRAVQPTAPADRSALTGRSPPWLVPSLSKLCVLRT